MADFTANHGEPQWGTNIGLDVVTETDSDLHRRSRRKDRARRGGNFGPRRQSLHLTHPSACAALSRRSDLKGRSNVGTMASKPS